VVKFVLNHRHRPEECRAAYAAWNGFDSPLRDREAVASCASGGHGILWTVEADDEQRALALLPRFVAERTEVNAVREVLIP
jgi:hypothetical protein